MKKSKIIRKLIRENEKLQKEVLTLEKKVSTLKKEVSILNGDQGAMEEWAARLRHRFAKDIIKFTWEGYPSDISLGDLSSMAVREEKKVAIAKKDTICDPFGNPIAEQKPAEEKPSVTADENGNVLIDGEPLAACQPVEILGFYRNVGEIEEMGFTFQSAGNNRIEYVMPEKAYLTVYTDTNTADLRVYTCGVSDPITYEAPQIYKGIKSISDVRHILIGHKIIKPCTNHSK